MLLMLLTKLAVKRSKNDNQDRKEMQKHRKRETDDKILLVKQLVQCKIRSGLGFRLSIMVLVRVLGTLA